MLAAVRAQSGVTWAVHGPFITNDEAQLAAAFERYRRGEMGRLVPLARTDRLAGLTDEPHPPRPRVPLAPL